MDAASIASNTRGRLQRSSWNGPASARPQQRTQEKAQQLPHLLGYNSRPHGGSGAMSRKKAPQSNIQAPTQQAPETAAPKGAISMLQEYVQCSTTFHVPSNYSVLQWQSQSRMADAATLEFRAVVALLLEGVPHHVAGTWQPKKKDAQRDAAERALKMFVGCMGQLLEGQQRPPALYNYPAQMGGARAPSLVQEEDILKDFCKGLEACGGVEPSITVDEEGDTYRVITVIVMFGVPYHFQGEAKSSETAARADAARRILWYLQHPDFQDAFEPDPQSTAILSGKIPEPPARANWLNDSDASQVETAERKTAIMRVQNKLQQRYSKDLKPGMSVWQWNFEFDQDDQEMPQLCRASVDIPVIGRQFVGDWVRGQRDAQLNTIQQVTSFLELDANA